MQPITESFKLFLFFSHATFSLLSLATSTTATHSLRQSGCNLSRQDENCCANSTSYSHHSTKQYKIQQAPCCYRSSGKDAGSSIDAIETKPCMAPSIENRTLLELDIWYSVQGSPWGCGWLLIRPFFAFRQKSLFIPGCEQGAII